MATGLYFRVHPTLHPLRPSELLSPLEANPASAARLAIRGDATLGVAPRAMFYVATSPAAALLEARFRNPQLYSGRRIVVPWHTLPGWTLSTVRLLTPQRYVPLMKPERGLVIQDPAKDAAWQGYVNTFDHSQTHEPAAEVAAQFAATMDANGIARVLPGFGYASVQSSSDSVFLHHLPPMDPAAWTVEASVNLGTPEGLRAVLAALAAAGLLPTEQPPGASSPLLGFDPPPGAL
jgi:hypothetical protein